ncbi:MAG: DMT family transporter [Candidatus Pacebacteria bacterium]|nr:DMT family transporter [Candidatus Paceibacterota bacterium]
MPWYIFALVGPIFWAISNHIDKYLVERFYKKKNVGENNVGSLVIFTGIAEFVTACIVFIFTPHSIPIAALHAVTIIFGGMILIGSFILYLGAIEREEASIVTPLWQMVPVFAYILSYFVLGETLSGKQIVAAILVISGAILISLNFKKRNIKIKTAVIGRMMLASFLVALHIVIFKTIALEENYWASIFWDSIGSALFALILFLSIRSYRKQFLSILRENTRAVLTVNFISEGVNAAAGLSYSYALLLAPIALVSVINGLQPFFAFLIGILLTLFLPSLGKEKIGSRSIGQKLVAIALIFIGIYLLFII